MPDELTAWLSYSERSFIIRIYRSLAGWTEELTEEGITVDQWPASGIHHTTARDALIFALTIVIDTVDHGSIERPATARRMPVAPHPIGAHTMTTYQITLIVQVEAQNEQQADDIIANWQDYGEFPGEFVGLARTDDPTSPEEHTP